MENNSKKKSIYFQSDNLERLDNLAKQSKRKRGDMLNRIIDFYFDAQDMAKSNRNMTAEQLVKEAMK